MSKPKHTSGPWKSETTSAGTFPCIRILGPDGSANAWVYDTQHAENAANAFRIIECVNACEGLDDPSVIPEIMSPEKGT